ncbi:hypothetical protein L0668_02160 [Paraglaciecola aquimarina]|uniref:Phytase-like domain-containing protein n=1 Tax=Paraglaciecola algarum TaxID=3050085 RepID=A0ABS9D1V7_9ALTE|nr:hypothetical protein [Paraglaciecola sp. G1-23]MCF2946893.1 hypothetical protein [Paraglaciecola sp. G1-23]
MKLSVLFRSLLIFAIFLMMSNCSINHSQPLDYHIIDEYQLNNELTETSGLACLAGENALTINDSGNKPIIYTVNGNGQVVNQQQLPLTNYDWEAISVNKKQLFIGDIGNNSGKRPFVQIHVFSIDEKVEFINTIDVSYGQNELNNNQYMAHDFDAESLVSANENLYLFSKSWKSKQLFIYQVPLDGSKHHLNPSWTVKGLPGVITGGDYDKLNRRFILVGYELAALGWFKPFITILDDNFNLVKSFQLNQYSQVEGLCINPNGEVWITQESSYFSGQKLIKLQIR